MCKRSCRWFLTLITLCAVVWMWSFASENDKSLDFTILSKAWAAAPAKPASTNTNSQSFSSVGQSQVKGHTLPLMVQRLYLKAGHVRITIAGSGKGGLDLEDYPATLVKVAGSKTTGSGQWTLAQVDPGHVLLSLKGKIDFDTQLVLKKTDRLTATIIFGTWKHTKQETLTPPSILTGAPAGRSASSQSAAPPAPTGLPVQAPAGTKTGPAILSPTTMKAEGKRPTKDLAPMNKAMAGAINRRSTTHTPSSLHLDDAGGIRMALPGEGQIMKPGDSLSVNAFFLNELPDPTAVENVDFTLKKLGVPDVFLTVSRLYRQSSDDRNCPASFNIPTRGLPLGSGYYILATHPEAWGIGNTFTIQTPGDGNGRVFFLRPWAGELLTRGSPITINYHFNRRVGAGIISYEFYKLDAEGRYGAPIASFTRFYNPNASEPLFTPHTASFTIPSDLPFGQYFWQISHPEVSGRSSTFTIGTVAINIFQPRAGVNITPGSPMHLSYQFSRSVGGGPTQFTLRKALAETGGGIQRMPHPIASFTRTYSPGTPGAPEPIYTFEYTLPSDIEVGQYYWELGHGAVSGSNLAFQAFGRSGTFNVTSDINGSGEILCDYSLESATYKDGRPLDADFRVGSDSIARPEFRVHLRWNGVTVPRGHYSAGALPYTIGIYSAVTREPLGTHSFQYKTEDSFNINVNAAFARDRVPLLQRDGVIPLEFRLEKASSDTIDYYSNNNLLTANMGISNAVENNMAIDLDSSDFSLTRTPHTGSRPDRYHLTQRFKVRNISGGSGINTRVMGCLYRKDAGGSWDSPATTLCGGLDVDNARTDWIWKTFTIDFNEDKPWNIPNDTRFRLVLQVDPDRELIDSDRSNNTAIHTFRITGRAPGSGSGTVVGH